ncbi:MAG: hypothetical protein ACFFDF_20940 [Candidatus Odinarchaeota archaeon]
MIKKFSNKKINKNKWADILVTAAMQIKNCEKDEDIIFNAKAVMIGMKKLIKEYYS